MLKKAFLNTAIIVLLISLLVSCSEFQKTLKSTDYNLKYDKAIAYYKEKDFYRAQSLFDELINIYKGTGKSEEILFYYAYCYYGQKDYSTASHYFKNYELTYPNGIHKEECSYMAAYCYFLESPETSLDQSYTKKSIEELQLFINRYPTSTRVKDCNENIEKLRSKLETKSYDNAKLYYDLGEYKAAITSLKSSLYDYPDTDYREKLLYLILKSSFLLAENSVEAKKIERYKNTLTEYKAFLDEFPTSEYQKEATRIFEQTNRTLNN
jgi:outer membrane protein assembly factor BamD